MTAASHSVLPVLINGKWVASRAPASREVRNPATLELLGRVSDCTVEEVAQAVAAARAAQVSWWRIPGVEKATLLHEVARRIRAQGEGLAALLTKESGKPLCESV